MPINPCVRKGELVALLTHLHRTPVSPRNSTLVKVRDLPISLGSITQTIFIVSSLKHHHRLFHDLSPSL